MKRTHLTSLAAAALLAAGTGLALAHGDGTYNKDSGSDGRAHHGHHGSFFERIDSDSNGEVTREEAREARKSWRERMHDQ